MKPVASSDGDEDYYIIIASEVRSPFMYIPYVSKSDDALLYQVPEILNRCARS